MATNKFKLQFLTIKINRMIFLVGVWHVGFDEYLWVRIPKCEIIKANRLILLINDVCSSMGFHVISDFNYSKRNAESFSHLNGQCMKSGCCTSPELKAH